MAADSENDGAAGDAEQVGNGDAAEHKGVAVSRLVTLLLAGTAMGQGAGWTVIPGAIQRWQGGTGQGASGLGSLRRNPRANSRYCVKIGLKFLAKGLEGCLDTMSPWFRPPASHWTAAGRR